MTRDTQDCASIVRFRTRPVPRVPGGSQSLSLSWIDPSSDSFSHMSPVLMSVIVPSPLST